jgi:hypothetical protein
MLVVEVRITQRGDANSVAGAGIGVAGGMLRLLMVINSSF